MFIVQIAGHLGRDPETRFTPNGQKVTSFTVAVNQRRGKEETTTWVRVTVWGDRFDKILSFLKKGSAVIVTGRMNPPSKYQDKEGQTQFSLEVTAEMIDFSPFGKTDRSAEGQVQFAGAPSQTNEASYSPGYDEGQFQTSSSHYGKSSYGAQNGTGNGYSQAMDEDTLPF